MERNQKLITKMAYRRHRIALAILALAMASLAVARILIGYILSLDIHHGNDSTSDLLQLQQGEEANGSPPNLKYFSSSKNATVNYGTAPRLLHVIWGRPPPTDKGYGGKDRILDNEAFTGCCDAMIELALRSYIAILPKDFTIYFWNLGGWDTVKYLKHIHLLNGTIIRPMIFNPQKELAQDTNLLQVYNSLSSIVPKSDLVRYVIMRNYGGTYVDLDGVMVRPLPLEDGIPRINLSPAVLDGYMNCTGVGYVRKSGTCVLSNGFFVGFPKRHIIFNTILNTIDKQKRTCGGKFFFCYGPQWVSETLMKEAGINDVQQVGVQVMPLLRNGQEYKVIKTAVISHFDFDVGDMTCDRNDLLAELCKRYNMTMRPKTLKKHLEQTKQRSNTQSIASTVNSVLYSNPSMFSPLTRYSKKCDTSQQKSWEVAVSARYEKDNIGCIAPKEGSDTYHGPSGPGSSLKATEELRKTLPLLFQKLNVKTFLDAPCGDWLWMQTVNLTGVQYFGGDISNTTVNKNRECFERGDNNNNNIHFHWFDITCMIPPPVDLILVRDVLFNLPENLVMEALANINESGARFLATTTFSEGDNGNWKHNMAYQDTLGNRTKMGLQNLHIGFQRLNLYGPPFSLPSPVWKVDDIDSGKGRHVGVWTLPLMLQQ